MAAASMMQGPGVMHKYSGGSAGVSVRCQAGHMTVQTHESDMSCQFSIRHAGHVRAGKLHVLQLSFISTYFCMHVEVTYGTVG
jgi:hypothetical protein